MKQNLIFKAFVLCLLFLASFPARAQFYTTGSDPGHLRWFSIETPYYQVIYPEGTDSLARNYARLLERFRKPSGYSIGLTPGSLQWHKMPVVLHAYNGYANGSVSWAPSHMNLYTVMEPSASDPAPWDIQLISHEPRHQAQLQLGYSGFLKPFNYLFGEAVSPVSFMLYLDMALAEGDAVAAETGFGYGTRARTADFLDYYRLALDQGDFRTWDRWRYGSYKHYTPSYYTLGYITIAGMRYYYDYPTFTADFLNRSLRRPFSFTPRNMMKTASERSGKPFKETFSEILQNMDRQWKEESAARGPFIPQEQLAGKPGFPVFYSGAIFMEGILYTIRSSSVRGVELVAFKDGKETVLFPMNTSVTSLWNDDANLRLYWTETVPDPRWELSHRSIIRYYDIRKKKTVDLTTEGRLYNPQPSGDGLTVAAVEYPVTGGNRILVLNSADGSILRRIPVPDGLQVSETAWWKDSLFAAAISEKGTGIYRIGPDGNWTTVFEPVIQKVFNLGFDPDYLEWVSDRTGVNEYYRFYPEEGRLTQLTSTRYGLYDVYEEDGYLYFTAPAREGGLLYRSPMEALSPKDVSFYEVHTYPMEDALVAQERALGPVPEEDAEVEISVPKRYSRILHGFRFHTWLPFFTDYEQLESGSLDFTYKTASLGVTGFFQNTLDNLNGYVGYSAHPDPDGGQAWMHSIHGKFTYSGLYPVIEGSFDIGGSHARQYHRQLWRTNEAGQTVSSASSYLKSTPSVQMQLSAYLPLRFNKGSMLAGVIPRVSYTVSNNAFATNAVLWEGPLYAFSSLPYGYHFAGFGEGGNRPMQSLSASLRGYWMLPVASNGVYPRLGIGAEAGVRIRPGLTNVFTPAVFAYAYGYLPGIVLPQGLRLTGMYQRLFGGNSGPRFIDNAVHLAPRGYPASAGTLMAGTGPSQWKVTADYALPVYVGDLSLGVVSYIKNFLLVPHADFAGFKTGNLWSAGIDLTAEIAHLLMFPFDGSIGLSFNYLGGSGYKDTGLEKPYSIEMIFSFDI